MKHNECRTEPITVHNYRIGHAVLESCLISSVLPCSQLARWSTNLESCLTESAYPSRLGTPLDVDAGSTVLQIAVNELGQPVALLLVYLTCHFCRDIVTISALNFFVYKMRHVVRCCNDKRKPLFMIKTKRESGAKDGYASLDEDQQVAWTSGGDRCLYVVGEEGVDVVAWRWYSDRVRPRGGDTHCSVRVEGEDSKRPASQPAIQPASQPEPGERVK
ncbi:hypothetical protein ALC56_00201 [Trachymyrmex septentrionalis]|uniref:Uncharacterized protein n=1 Tax=Trachymyrmex septentrionalis TaxID=34720 RepID=A0A195FXG1_9HYME|nr:hypothetical protein ALC56_00201 [Trachymyrmex septentrionalis]